MRVQYQAPLAAVAGLLLAGLAGLVVPDAPRAAAALAVAAVGMLILVRWPALGLYAIVIGMFFDDFNVPTGIAALGVGDLAIFGALPAWLYRHLTHSGRPRLPQRWWLLVAFLALTYVSMIMGVRPSMGYGAYARLLTYFVAIVAIINMIEDDETVERVAWLMVVCASIHAFFSLTQQGPSMRLGGLVDQPNVLGQLLAMGMLPAAGLVMRERRVPARIFLIGALAMTAVAVMLSVSRGTYLSLSIAFIWWMRHHRRMLVVGVLVAGSLLFVTSEFRSQRQMDAISGRLEMKDSSVRNRIQVIKNGAQVIASSPLLGVGYNQFTEIHQVVEINAEARRGSHNFYMGMAASIGLPAIFVLIAFVATHGVLLGRRRREAEALALAGSAKLNHPRPGPASRSSSISATTRSDLTDEALQRRVWVLSLAQAMMIWHTTSLLTRGGSRIADWGMMALYCAVALLPPLRLNEGAEAPAAGHPVPAPKPLRLAPALSGLSRSPDPTPMPTGARHGAAGTALGPGSRRG